MIFSLQIIAPKNFIMEQMIDLKDLLKHEIMDLHSAEQQIIDALPSMIEKDEGKDGLKLKVNSNRFKIGNGGALQNFETFNGDVIVKEK